MKKALLALALALIASPAFAVDCHISVARYIGVDNDGRDVQALREPATTQKVTFTSTSVQSTTLGSAPAIVRIICTAKAHFEFGANPTASNADPFLSANTPEYFFVNTSGLLVAFQDGN